MDIAELPKVNLNEDSYLQGENGKWTSNMLNAINFK